MASSPSSSDSAYSYSLLPSSPTSIRLLILNPDFPRAEINCRLETVPLDSAPNYEALSYAWGPPLLTETIFIRGAPLRVTRNLFAALQNIRDPVIKQRFWIDAICINQSDIDERNSQVQIMPLIYSNASIVLIWLGVKDSYIDTAWNLLEKWHFGTIPQRITEDEYLGLEKVFQKPSWWTRLWVVQEVVFARACILQCGNRVLPWDFLGRARPQIEDLPPSRSDDKRRLTKIMQVGVGLIACQIAHHLVQSTGHKEQLERLENYIENWATPRDCMDKRDIIYVMLNIVPLRDDQPKIKPDYNKSIYAVYCELTRHMLISHNKLSTLCNTYHAYTDIDTHQTFPSWSIDWSRRRIMESLINYFSSPLNPKAGTLFYSASGGTKIDESIFHPTNPNMLILQGVVFDTITSVTESYDESAFSSWQPKVRNWRPSNLSQISYPTGEDATDAYIRTLFRDISRHTFGMPKARLPPSQLLIHREHFSSWSTGEQDGEWDRNDQLSAGSGDVESMKDFILALAFSTNCWCFFVTSKGYFGLSQTGARTGDSVVVIEGACTPLVLRPAAEEARNALAPNELEERHWSKVSAAYVHGIMDGEVMSMLDRQHVVKEEVLLI